MVGGPAALSGPPTRALGSHFLHASRRTYVIVWTDIGVLPWGGRGDCPLVADKNGPVADMNLPMRLCRGHWSLMVCQVRGLTPFPCRAWAKRDAVSAGLAEVCVVEQPVDGWWSPTFWA